MRGLSNTFFLPAAIMRGMPSLSFFFFICFFYILAPVYMRAWIFFSTAKKNCIAFPGNFFFENSEWKWCRALAHNLAKIDWPSRNISSFIFFSGFWLFFVLPCHIQVVVFSDSLFSPLPQAPFNPSLLIYLFLIKIFPDY